MKNKNDSSSSFFLKVLEEKPGENQLHFSGIDDAIDIDREQERNNADDAIDIDPEQEQNIVDNAIDIDREQERNIADDAIDIDPEQERNIADAIDVEDDEQNSTDHVNFEEVNERNRSSTSFNVSPEQIKSQFGKSRKDAAKNLGVSISTFKRKCRDYDIKRWPSRMNNINNPSLYRTKVANKCVENADHQTSEPSDCDLTIADLQVDPNISSPPIPKTKELANTCQSVDVVIKPMFKDETLKFEFCVSGGMEKLKEEVGKRLNLQTKEFKLKYVDDDDGDLISLTCDGDLKFYVKTMKSIGKTSVQVLVNLISE